MSYRDMKHGIIIFIKNMEIHHICSIDPTCQKFSPPHIDLKQITRGADSLETIFGLLSWENFNDKSLLKSNESIAHIGRIFSFSAPYSAILFQCEHMCISMMVHLACFGKHVHMWAWAIGQLPSVIWIELHNAWEIRSVLGYSEFSAQGFQCEWLKHGLEFSCPFYFSMRTSKYSSTSHLALFSVCFVCNLNNPSSIEQVWFWPTVHWHGSTSKPNKMYIKKLLFRKCPKSN
mgnify:CR=1 FL=1